MMTLWKFKQLQSVALTVLIAGSLTATFLFSPPKLLADVACYQSGLCYNSQFPNDYGVCGGPFDDGNCGCLYSDGYVDQLTCQIPGGN